MAIKLASLRSIALLLSLFMPVSVSALDVGETAPDWTLTNAAGDEVNFHADAPGDTAVVLFWATWCPYCRALMPHLQKLADEFSGAPVTFYALNVWEDSDPVRYLEKHGFTFELLLTADLVADDYGVRGTPGLFVVDGAHRVRYKRRSGEDDAEVEAAVRKAIEDSISTP